MISLASSLSFFLSFYYIILIFHYPVVPASVSFLHFVPPFLTFTPRLGAVQFPTRHLLSSSPSRSSSTVFPSNISHVIKCYSSYDMERWVNCFVPVSVIRSTVSGSRLTSDFCNGVSLRVVDRFRLRDNKPTGINVTGIRAHLVVFRWMLSGTW